MKRLILLILIAVFAVACSSKDQNAIPLTPQKANNQDNASVENRSSEVKKIQLNDVSGTWLAFSYEDGKDLNIQITKDKKLIHNNVTYTLKEENSESFVFVDNETNDSIKIHQFKDGYMTAAITNNNLTSNVTYISGKKLSSILVTTFKDASAYTGLDTIMAEICSVVSKYTDSKQPCGEMLIKHDIYNINE